MAKVDCPCLVLGRRWAGDDDERPPILLVAPVDAIGLCSEDAYDPVSCHLVEWELKAHSHGLSWDMRSFASQLRLTSPYSTTNQDHDLMERIAAAVGSGELVGIRRRKALGDSQDEPVLEQRRIVAAITAKTGGRLNLSGRQYRLVPGDDLARTPDRESYEVVAAEDASRVLDGLAKESGREDLGALFAKAKEKLTSNWRPPLKPNGLVLLRRTRVQVAASRHHEAITPSQMAKLLTDEQSVTLEIVVLGFDDEPLDGVSYVIGTPDDEVQEGDLGASGKLKVTSLKKGNAGVALKWADGGANAK